MSNKTKRNLIILVILGGVAWWYMPTLQGIAAARPQPSQPQYVAPGPQQQPAYQEPAQIILEPPVIRSIPQRQPEPVIIDQVPTKDWTDEITAVNKVLRQAEELVQVCAMEKMIAASSMPPKIIDCTPTVENLNHAKQLVRELQEQIREGNR